MCADSNSHELGLKNVVGSLGTAVTEQQLVAAASLSDSGTVILLMDNDPAGEHATIRAQKRLRSMVTASAAPAAPAIASRTAATNSWSVSPPPRTIHVRLQVASLRDLPTYIAKHKLLPRTSAQEASQGQGRLQVPRTSAARHLQMAAALPAAATKSTTATTATTATRSAAVVAAAAAAAHDMPISLSKHLSGLQSSLDCIPEVCAYDNTSSRKWEEEEAAAAAASHRKDLDYGGGRGRDMTTGDSSDSAAQLVTIKDCSDVCMLLTRTSAQKALSHVIRGATLILEAVVPVR